MKLNNRNMTIMNLNMVITLCNRPCSGFAYVSDTDLG